MKISSKTTCKVPLESNVYQVPQIGFAHIIAVSSCAAVNTTPNSPAAAAKRSHLRSRVIRKQRHPMNRRIAEPYAPTIAKIEEEVDYLTQVVLAHE